MCNNIPTFAAVKLLNQIIAPIADELAQFEAFFRQTLRADTEPMDSIMRYASETKGKRIRPILVLLSAKLFGEVNSQTLRAATFVEMVHSATLIHDDVVDDADERRNRASLKAKFGNLSAVLAGDYLLAKAVLLLSHPEDQAVLQEMLSTTAAMSEGELMQNQNNSNYIDIITRKTAMLMRSCCVAGALSAKAANKQVQEIADFGLNFGILFQLRDDILDKEHTEQARALLPTYQSKVLQALKTLPHNETAIALQELTLFCAERME